MNKKVGIITIIDYVNYGNRLQNYAMERLLNNLGFEAYTIPQVYYEDRDYLIEYVFLNAKKQLYTIKGLVRIVHKLKRRKLETSDVKDNIGISNRRSKFNSFNETNLHLDGYVIKSRMIDSRFKKKYDYFVTGSDQVWNPVFKWSKYIMYLRFAPKRKRIAISASFGVSDIPSEQQRIVSRYLKGMRYISVRESSGSKIVEKYTGKKCDVLMDPTLLVTNDTWNDLTSDVNVSTPERYMAVYFLGNVSTKREKFIEQIANNNKYEVVWLNSEKSPEYFSIGPDEFVSVIKHAQMIVTDSFHGCVFSIVFKKQFVVFKREGFKIDMFDRIETLLNMVELTSQINNDDSDEYTVINENRYLEVEKKLLANRLESERIIKTVMV